MRCRVLVTVPPSQNNWPLGSLLQSTQPPSSLACLVFFASSSLPLLLLPRQYRTPPDWLVVSRKALASWPSSLLYFSLAIPSSIIALMCHYEYVGMKLRGPLLQPLRDEYRPLLFISDFEITPPSPLPMFAFVVTPLANRFEGEGGVIYLRITVCWKKCLWYIFNGVVNTRCLIYLKLTSSTGHRNFTSCRIWVWFAEVCIKTKL